MRESVVLVFRDALANLLDSVDAALEVERAEIAPEQARLLASKLQVRFTSAERLARGKFVGGSRIDTRRVAIICGAITKVQGAYVSYCGRPLRGAAGDGAAEALDAVLKDARR